MKSATQFVAETRETRGKGGARAVRAAGRVPGILYGKGTEPTAISLPEKELRLEYLKGGFFSKIITLELGGKTLSALPKSVELHPVSDKVEHIDFVAIDANSKIHVFVPVKVLNAERSVGIKRGGVLNIVRHEIELICIPDKIPPMIEIDVIAADIGDSIHISAVTLPEGVEPAIKRDFTIATIAGRQKEEEEVKPEVAATAAAGVPGAAAAPVAGAAAPAAAGAKAPAAKAPAAKK